MPGRNLKVEGRASNPHRAEIATPQERARCFREWAESHPPRRETPLSDEAISRESIYNPDPD